MIYQAKTNIINVILSSICYIFFYKFIINKPHQIMKKIIKLLSFLYLIQAAGAYAGDLSVGIGNFDYSDKNKSAIMVDMNYGFTENNMNSPIGKVIPIIGAFITEDSSAMAYAGAKIDYKLGMFVITPSFAPGFYREGDGKDLGHALEFKSQVNIGFNIGSGSVLSAGYSHISNASLGDKNPGANTYSLNFLTQF